MAQDEVLPDYGDEYWPEDGAAPLPPPKSNYQSPSSNDGGEDSDSSWEPPPSAIERTPTTRPRSTRKAPVLPASNDEQVKASAISRALYKRKIYVVAVGRCVGLFRSVVRVNSSALKYPGQEIGKFTSEGEARDYLAERGVEEPTCFWKSSYASGTLVQDPDAVVGQDVYFPVGRGVHADEVQHGVVTSSVVQEDNRMWKVQMDDGFIDTMSEWPLLCGLSMSEEKLASGSSRAMRKETSGETQPEEADIVFYAIRGTSNDGIVHLISDVFPRLVGDHAEYESFDSECRAREWIDENQFYAVLLQADGSKVVKKEEIVEATRGRKGIRVQGPSTRRVAAEEVEKWDAQRKSRKSSVFVRRAFKPKQDECIARLKDGNRCGKSDDLRDTLLGPMCKKHAMLCKSGSEEESADEEEHVAEGVDVHYAKRQRVRAPVREERAAGQEAMESPVVGVKLPEMIESLKKDRKGMFAVVAVRTFPDEDCPEEAAGSVWLSSDSAAKANVRHGAMRIFNETEDIFENIELAHEWIKGQVSSSASTDLEGEASKRWQAAQKRIKARKSGKKGRSDDNTGDSDREKDVTDDEPGARGAGKGSRNTRRGGRGAGTRNRGKNRKGRGAGRGDRGARKGGRGSSGGSWGTEKYGGAKSSKGKGRKASNTRKSSRDESEDTDSDEESDEASDDEHSTGPSRGDRRFRKSRRRGSNRGGLRSGAIKMLDKKQKRVENQLFPDDADEVTIFEFDVPDVKLCQKIPLPGKAQALTTSKDAKHVISFGNDMKAELAEKVFKSFDAFSLADLMEFQETVEYVASYQPAENKRVTESVVQAVRVIASNAVHLYSSMRDSDTMGNHGENFKAYTYLQIMYLVMFREAFDSSLAELWFVSYAPKFARMARGCPGMAPFKDVREAAAATSASSNDRCLVCGKKGHRADSDVHKAEIAEGALSMSPGKLKSALAYIASDATLNAEQKRSWSARIKAFYAKMTKNSREEDSL